MESYRVLIVFKIKRSSLREQVFGVSAADEYNAMQIAVANFKNEYKDNRRKLRIIYTEAKCSY